MKTTIITIAVSLILLCSLISCTDDTQAFVQKIERTQIELKKQDSILIAYRSEISSIAYMPPSNDGPIKYSMLNSLAAFIRNVSPLITRLELMIEKNKLLIDQVKTNTGDAKEVENEYQIQVDEFELMKRELTAITKEYEEIISNIKRFETTKDSTNVQ